MIARHLKQVDMKRFSNCSASVSEREACKAPMQKHRVPQREEKAPKQKGELENGKQFENLQGGFALAWYGG